MRTIRVAATAVALGLLLSGTGLAQAEEPTTPPSSPTTTTSRTTDSGSTVTGKVTNVNLSGRSFTVELPSGTMTFHTNSSTAFKASMPAPSGSMDSGMPAGTTGSMGTLSSLKVGDQVQVAYSGTSGGNPTATSIQVMSATGSGTQESLGSMTGSTGTTGSTYGSTGTTGTGSTTGSTYPSTGSTGSTTGSMTGSTSSTTGTTYGTTGTTTNRSTGMMGTSVIGTVVSVDPASNTVTVETSNGRETFHADANSRFLASGRTVQLRELKAGDTVTLNFTTTGADRMISRGEVTQGTRSASATTTPTTTTTTPSSTYGSSATTGADTDDTDDLPATASPTFAVLTTGLVLLMSGLSLRRRRRA